MDNSRPLAVDLFCGAGGMSLGFEQAGFDVTAAVDSNPIHLNTYARNFPEAKTLEIDLSEATGNGLRQHIGLAEIDIDVVFGGPPCQGFSRMGRRRSDDPRNEMLHHFARMVSELRPKYFVLENVPGLLAEESKSHLERFLVISGNSGYSVVNPIAVLDASEFGVPQRRRRVFVMGYRDDAPEPRNPTPYPVLNVEYRPPTVTEAISDLPEVGTVKNLLQSDTWDGNLTTKASYYAMVLRGEIQDSEDASRSRNWNGTPLTGCKRSKHSAQTISRFRSVEPGDYEPVSKYFRLPGPGLANTLRAGTGPSKGSFTAPRPIHPIAPRCITVREAARLHSFPDWFQFHNSIWHGFRQVGNSVPPLLARAVASKLMEALAATS